MTDRQSLNIPTGTGRDRATYERRKVKKRKGYEYQTASLLRFSGVDSPEEITQAHVDQFRDEAEHYSTVTIEAAIKAVTILTGNKFSGESIRHRQRAPKLVPLEDLSKVYAAARKRQNCLVSRFLKWSYITGLRLSDLLTLHRDQMDAAVIQVEAGKTGKLHLIPRHPILNVRLPNREYPLYRSPSRLRKRIKHYCELAKVPYFTPQMIRRTSANEYERAVPGAGGVLLGHSLGSVTWRYYLDQTETLRKAQHALRIPDAMIPKTLRDSDRIRDRSMREAFDALDREMQDMLLRIAQQMTGKGEV